MVMDTCQIVRCNKATTMAIAACDDHVPRRLLGVMRYLEIALMFVDRIVGEVSAPIAQVVGRRRLVWVCGKAAEALVIHVRA